ncbi:MAG: putative lipid II flippase FtsW [Lachnospiraceae bacterium]|jgi:cell division protein FtsW|nr:putative lipid II flippase FtsW [Lachnospiraceae bacterium]
MSNQTKRKEVNMFDFSLLFIVLFLLCFGLVMIYSVSSYEASMRFGDAAYFLKSQLLATGLGLVLMIVIANIKYPFWEKFATLAFVISHVLVLLVLSPLGIERNNARRWLDIFGTSLQPAEVAKLGIILFMASFICKIGTKNIGTLKGFLTVLIMPLPLCFIVWQITTNLSSAIIIFGIVLLMLFVASPKYKHFIVAGVVGMVVVMIIVFVIINVAASDNLGFRSERVLAWLDPEAYAQGRGFQTLQALYAIGSGGFFGKGLGQSMQKLGFLPEAQNDMIFSIISEELGLFGAIAIILMFMLLVWRFMYVAREADLFGTLLVVGVMGHIVIQVIINIGVVTNLIPNTGITLPFISYGGSSVTFLLIEIGLVLSVAKFGKQIAVEKEQNAV